MPRSFQFTPNGACTAEVNVVYFVDQCREFCTKGGTSWENLNWAEVAFTKLGAPRMARGVVLPEHKLSADFIEFCKAYFWYVQSHNSQTNISFHYLALRLIESALLKIFGNANVWNCNLQVLEETVVLARKHYTGATPNQLIHRVVKVANFLALHRLAKDNIKGWRSPLKTEWRASTKIGPKAEAYRQKKLPDVEALDAIAEIFANEPQLPRDVVVTSFIAMSMCAPQRASEILALPVSAEINPKGKDGIERYGWRFFSNKGFEGDIKWIPNAIADIGKLAFKRIKTLTEPGRQLAQWIEQHPDLFYRHEACPDVMEDQPLTIEQAALALGFNPTLRRNAATALASRGLTPRDGAHSLRSLWTHVLGRLPKSFPWLDKEKKIRFSEALFCVLRNQNHATRGTIPVELQVLPPNFFVFDLGPRDTVEHHKSLFDRHGYTGSDGRPLKLTTHQPRHLLNTIAHRAGMSQEYIAKWSGRADPRQNRTYNHTTDAENLAKIRDAIVAAPAPESVKSINSSSAPVSQDDFTTQLSPAVHVTEFGFCVHNFIISPCLRYRDCVNCSEQICVKGDGDKLARLQLRLGRLETALALALQENEGTIIGADRWITHHRMTIERVKQMIALLSDSSLPDGSLIRLTGESYSHIHRALAKAPTQIQKARAHGAASLVG